MEGGLLTDVIASLGDGGGRSSPSTKRSLVPKQQRESPDGATGGGAARLEGGETGDWRERSCGETVREELRGGSRRRSSSPTGWPRWEGGGGGAQPATQGSRRRCCAVWETEWGGWAIVRED
ncbi:unnamed protein product [Linum trigynum]|uniref:Uncharacterized protein n=1 Tax=Linum trigynum TaxID=586398 RepID=A0AAV2F4Q7_9ROSI